jgi:ABC-type lipoprotein export system ATPase subunit
MEQPENRQLDHTTKTPIIEAVGITKVFKIGKQMISPVSDISIQIGYGDFVIVFGPSGAGKSTLINIISGLEKPDIGQVILKGEDLYGYPAEDRAKIRLRRFGFVTQKQYWVDNISIVENIAIPLLLQGKTLAKALPKAQKASLARSLINDPWIIFADEPTEHLDTKSSEEVVKILKDLNENEGKTVIMITHNLEYLQLSKKWFFVKDGRLWDVHKHKDPFGSITEAIKYIGSLKKEEQG